MYYERIDDDINKIRLLFGNNLISIGLFGSFLNKPIWEINDIDIVIVTKKIFTSRYIISHLNNKLNIQIGNISYNLYGGGGGSGGTRSIFKKTSKHLKYDIVIIEENKIKCNFMEVNNNNICYIN